MRAHHYTRAHSGNGETNKITHSRLLHVSFDVYPDAVSTKTKRTYNISEEAIETVKRLVEERHLAPSQDALVERAIADYARRVRDDDDARLWETAGSDAQFQSEVEELDVEFAQDDIRAWES